MEVFKSEKNAHVNSKEHVHIPDIKDLKKSPCEIEEAEESIETSLKALVPHVVVLMLFAVFFAIACRYFTNYIGVVS